MLAGAIPGETEDCGTFHNFGTQETQRCAMIEGFADFVGVDAWNDDDDGSNPDGYYLGVGCTGPFGNPESVDHCPESPDNTDVIDVESVGCYDGCVTKYMETYFSSGTWPGTGVETDWMRTYWDYHTNNPGSLGVVPSHGRMLSEWAAVTSATEANLYDRYRLGVASYSGCGQYERLVEYASGNGADHCDGSCDNVPSCTDCDATDCAP
jgi:hypothetical protein